MTLSLHHFIFVTNNLILTLRVGSLINCQVLGYTWHITASNNFMFFTLIFPHNPHPHTSNKLYVIYHLLTSV